MHEKDGLLTTAGFYTVRLTARGLPLLESNSERSFVITQLQDLFSFQPHVGHFTTIHHPSNIAHQADLLAYSITRTSITLLIFCTSKHVVHKLSQALISGLDWYHGEYRPSSAIGHDHITRIEKLIGPHHALEHSVALHLLHEDWEYDRYSSIGFYLHNRRGAWMRIWRMSKLYENNPVEYRRYITLLQSRLKGALVETSLHA